MRSAAVPSVEKKGLLLSEGRDVVRDPPQPDGDVRLPHHPRPLHPLDPQIHQRREGEEDRSEHLPMAPDGKRQAPFRNQSLLRLQGFGEY